MLRERRPRRERRRRIARRRSPAGAPARRQVEAEAPAAQDRVDLEPRPVVTPSVHLELRYGDGVARGMPPGSDDDVPAAGEDVREGEHRAREREDPGARHRRIEAERREHVPGGQRPEVVVAGVAARRRVEERARGADRARRLLGRPEPVVEPRDDELGLVPEEGERRARPLVQLPEMPSSRASARRRPPSRRASPATSNGTSHVYCAASPSTKPSSDVGSNGDLKAPDA